MAGLKARMSHAVTLHRQAAAAATAAASALDATRPAPADQREQHDLAERLRAAAAVLVPGWLGAPLDAQSEDTPLGGPGLPAFVRIGTAQPLDDARFPAVVPLLGTGHLTTDADTRDPRVAGLVRSILLRLLAAAPAGSLLVRGVDAATSGLLFAPFTPLTAAGLMPPPAADRTGLRAVLAEAEGWIRPARPAATRHHRRDHTLLLVIASLPELTEGADLARIAALAQDGPAAGLHLIVAGWPPPPLTEETTQPPLSHATMVALRNPYALVGNPPGASFGGTSPQPTAIGLNSPVFLDEDPPAHLIDRVCRELAVRLDAGSHLRLADLLPDEGDDLWTGDPSDGLVTTVGLAGDRAVTLRFDELTPHWLVGGRPGSGVSAFLVNMVYGLCTRYSPEALAIYLVDFAEGVSFSEFLPDERDSSWLPHVRAAGVEADRTYGLAVLRELDTELTRRSTKPAHHPTGLAPHHTTDPPDHTTDPVPPVPRILCVLAGFPVLTSLDDQLTSEANDLLERLARTGRGYGIHLILAGRTPLGGSLSYSPRDNLFGQFPVRVALPGGGEVLEPTNDAAVGLPLGAAVVNTAGGLGGPRGATRGHERVVRFPDPRAAPATLTELRHRLWTARPADSPAPTVFAGYAHHRLADDPTYRTLLADVDGSVDTSSGQPASAARPTVPAEPAALLGRTVDLAVTTATVPLGPVAGRHLAILGTSRAAAATLGAAARSVAAHHAPGSARFVVMSPTPETAEVASILVGDLRQWQEAIMVDASGLAEALTGDQPGYLVVFGMDGLPPDTLPAGLPSTLLHEGPARNVHLLSWWRQPQRLHHDLDGRAREEIAGMLFFDVPGAEVGLLLGRPVDWRPRPDRALLWDGQTDQTTIIIPFSDPADDRTPVGLISPGHATVGGRS
ncbi:FtsK/SpoIIIE domain-containing protein [Micromonospora polyrhachis]|uniref:FtsK domain-containing protein n=1 Tax=Micromonospora polyrhachis TaxID=1282883 RepID=A0A7W7WPZ3_9ACTN|nr:FtsK/SpoIIIE domain-containing protein [Micromonospora polyrhachis]MBB4959480.1 hypothetical protein [Micromonospora polyrhachis]